MTTANMASYRRAMGTWVAVFGAAALISGRTPAGDLTTDNLTVNKDSTFLGNVKVLDGSVGAAPTNGLVLYYSFATNANSVPDDSGNGNTGTVNGAAWVTNGQSGGAFSFDGSDDSIETAFQPVTGSSAWSVSVWFRTTKAAGELFLWKMGTETFGWTTVYAGISYDEDAVGVDCWGGWIKRAYGYGVRDGKWHHYVVVNNGSQASLWLDGSDVGNSGDGDSSSLNLGTGTFAVGRRPTGAPSPWDGSIDEVRIYDRALSTDEIRGLYLHDLHMTAGTARFETGVNYVLPLGDVGMGIYTNAP